MSDERPDFLDLPDVALETLGGSVLWANDEFFAEKENLLKPGPAEWREHEYTPRGKWMDGWETRRRRDVSWREDAPAGTPAGGGVHDQAIIRLGLPALVRGLVVDTSFFRGNYPPECSVEGCAISQNLDLDAALRDEVRWAELLPRSPLRGHAQNFFRVSSAARFTHLRLSLFPDGGVARLRVHGEPTGDWERLRSLGGPVDLAALENGARSIACSDMFFGSRHNLLLPGKPLDMGGGWETRRRRAPGNDWNLVQLAARGTIRRVEVDTLHFKGNAPGEVSLDACDAPGGAAQVLAGSADFRPLLGRTRTQRHTRHLFEPELRALGPVTHVRLNVFPDGGVARLRCWGEPEGRGPRQAQIEKLNALPADEAQLLLRAFCGSSAWVNRLLAARPFEDQSALVRAADRALWTLDEADWLEAFAAHPQIGEQPAAARASAPEASQEKAGGQHARWSAQEQAAVASAAAQTLATLSAKNAAYREKFGFIYIVRAAGRPADELLSLLEARLGNSRTRELRTAAEEQASITRLRIGKWLDA